MGSERKKKKNTDSENEDDRKIKRHRIERDEKPRSSKDDKSDEKKKKKKHHTDKEKKSKRKGNSKHDKHGDLLNLKIQELSSDDYFSKNNEFATWLKDERDLFFSDLASDSARKLFLKFVEEWNNKKLELRYYQGIETAPRSAHKWKIRK